ncbi:hypothetical protein P7245_11870, partial [Vibrio parahaemolyticus]|nr:hypothetical protein [Vibrio parahaemolyticus]
KLSILYNSRSTLGGLVSRLNYATKPMILKVTSPENYNFVMFEEGGKPIFYYVLVSEAIGFFFIYMILRGVR